MDYNTRKKDSERKEHSDDGTKSEDSDENGDGDVPEGWIKYEKTLCQATDIPRLCGKYGYKWLDLVRPQDHGKTDIEKALALADREANCVGFSQNHYKKNGNLTPSFWFHKEISQNNIRNDENQHGRKWKWHTLYIKSSSGIEVITCG